MMKNGDLFFEVRNLSLSAVKPEERSLPISKYDPGNVNPICRRPEIVKTENLVYKESANYFADRKG